MAHGLWIYNSECGYVSLKYCLTFDGSLLEQLRAEHSKSEEEDRKGKEDADSEADTPDGWQVIFSSGREHDQED